MRRKLPVEPVAENRRPRRHVDEVALEGDPRPAIIGDLRNNVGAAVAVAVAKRNQPALLFAIAPPRRVDIAIRSDDDMTNCTEVVGKDCRAESRRQRERRVAPAVTNRGIAATHEQQERNGEYSERHRD